MSDTTSAECRRNSWMIAAAGGVLVALMLLFIADFSVLAALIVGLLFFVVLGAFLVWAFCTGKDDVASMTASSPESRDTASPQPVKPDANPAPSPAAAMSAPAAVKREAAPSVPAVPKPTRKPATKKAGTKPAAAKRGSSPAKATKSAAKAAPAKPASAEALGAALAKSKNTDEPAAPEMLAAPRGGKGDDLKMIKGVGPALEKVLNEIGVWHFDQVASWKAKDIAHVDSKMVGFHGRITRDGWVKQARLLAKGEQTEFSKRVGKGDVY